MVHIMSGLSGMVAGPGHSFHLCSIEDGKMKILKNLIIIIAFLPSVAHSQEKILTPGGFVRGGIFLSTGDYKHNINALFGDASLNITLENKLNIKGYADLRARTGQQFGENSTGFELKEAWGMYYNRWMGISMGKKIVKWGKTDFFTPLSKFKPVDYSFRTPDREDSDLGNIVAELVVTPSSFFRFSFVSAPLWNPSILMTRPLEIPRYISLELPWGLSSENGFYSYGLRADFLLRGFDAGIQWFHGPDPMPGLKLVSADLSDLMNLNIGIKGVPYIINSAGADFEGVVAGSVVRGALSWSKPVEGKTGNEEVPFPMLEWVAGFDLTPGDFRITAEYSGRRIFDFYESPYEPLIGRELDLSQLALLFQDPLFDPNEFLRLQTEAFNRLYNNQLKEYYHSAGLRIEAETLYGRLIPSISGIYNFTSRDLVLLPALRYKPADGITLTAGLEYYSGAKGGLYDVIDDFMNSVFVSLRIDF